IVDAAPFGAYSPDHPYAEHRRQLLVVDPDALGRGLVAHIEGADYRDPQFLELKAEEEVALEVGRVEDVDDEVRLLVEDEIAGDDFVDGIGGEAVDAGQVDEAVLAALPEARALELLD